MKKGLGVMEVLSTVMKKMSLVSFFVSKRSALPLATIGTQESKMIKLSLLLFLPEK